MCRLLFVKGSKPFLIEDHLRPFAQICKHSQEYQGHGWGLACIKNGEWKIFRSIIPIWKDDLSVFDTTDYLMVHARSAFRDEDIGLENNMPFFDQNQVFIFNGELHGVRIKSQGRIGAEKLFKFIQRFDRGDLCQAMQKSVPIIKQRSKFIRGMNFMIGDGKRIYLNSYYNHDDGYYSMYSKRTNGTLIVCSEPYPGQSDWQKINNQTIEVIE